MSAKPPETVSATKARQNLGDLLSRVQIAKEEFVIERDGKQLAMLVPVKSETTDTSCEESLHQESVLKALAPSSSDIGKRLDFRNSAGICKALCGSVQGETNKLFSAKQTVEIKHSFKHGDSIFIDVDPVIYYWSKNDIYFSMMEEIFNNVYENNVQCFFSSITIIGSIIYQTEKKEYSLTKKCCTYLNNSENFNFIKTDESVSSLAATIKSLNNLDIDAAIQLGSAISVGADYFLTTNPVYKSGPNKILACAINIIRLDDLINCQAQVADLHKSKDGGLAINN